jgi:hypothetical protein
MDTEKAKLLINDFFEKTPPKDVFEKVLIELITEKHNILSNEEYDKNLIEKIDKIIESIQIYLTVSSK